MAVIIYLKNLLVSPLHKTLLHPNTQFSYTSKKTDLVDGRIPNSLVIRESLCEVAVNILIHDHHDTGAWTKTQHFGY